MNIEQDIAAWDEKSASDIAAIYEAYHQQSSFADTIVELVPIDTFQKGATWLLKHYLEAGNQLEKRHIKVIYSSLYEIERWETKLQVLQCMSFMPIANAETKIVESFLRIALADSNKFVRAWAYNGFYVLAIQYPEYQAEVEQFFEMAMRDEVASVKARLRNIMKKGFGS